MGAPFLPQKTTETEMSDGIRCPRCYCRDVRPLDQPEGQRPRGSGWQTEKTENLGGFIRRRRKCRHCGHIINTREVIE